ncbi:HNH endonuclease [Sulfitobacter sp. NAS-14.1]|uniref:HNH endonuclease n=1 Tax=Sulfitobacter pontiacus TaxID=60137 RepID=UPI000066B227|nr:possible EA31 gene protein, phage lambda [Sulfitobacter sp. NAS-14.1]
MYPLYKKYLDADSTVSACISRERSDLEKKLKLDKTDFDSAKSEYLHYADGGRLFDISPHVEKLPFSRTAYEDIYKKSLGSERATESSIRFSILDLAIAGKCPYCGANFVTDVDHFLPVSKFFKFSALTYNLVPACHPCNKRKLSKYGSCAEDSFFHPYFDDFDHLDWAECHVDLAGRLRIVYASSSSSGPNLKLRIDHFLKEVGIARTWKTHASHFLITKRSKFIGILKSKGPSGLRLYLEECLKDAREEEIARNNWKSSLISSLLCNAQFFTLEGLNVIPDKSLN